jgi:hypothetical protein
LLENIFIFILVDISFSFHTEYNWMKAAFAFLTLILASSSVPPVVTALPVTSSTSLSFTLNLSLLFAILTDRASDRRVSVKLVPTFADRGCHVVSAMDPHGRILGFPDQSDYYFFQVALHLYSRG